VVVTNEAIRICSGSLELACAVEASLDCARAGPQHAMDEGAFPRLPGAADCHDAGVFERSFQPRFGSSWNVGRHHANLPDGGGGGGGGGFANSFVVDLTWSRWWYCRSSVVGLPACRGPVSYAAAV